MEEPKSLDSMFQDKIFRIPDYQRGYAWQKKQLKDFWEDLINLSENRFHYTGVLTLKQVPKEDVISDANEYWLVKDRSHKLYHLVDGQQRLTTFIVFLQAYIEFVRGLPENTGLKSADIFVSETINIDYIEKKFLYETKPTGISYRTYKFGYTTDNPSHEYLKHKILGETGGNSIQETFYTHNLSNAKEYFSKQLQLLYKKDNRKASYQEIYRKITNNFLLNEYIIGKDFDVFVAFETMNNRGKQLSDLELLKNRLIYLTTLYDDSTLDPASRTILRDTINETWKEVYHQLGRNKDGPLKDDDYLRAHWTMYFKYSRKTGKDYIRFLLDEQFNPQRIYKKSEQLIQLDEGAEQSTEMDFSDDEPASDDISGADEMASSTQPITPLRPDEILNYVTNLKEASGYWFTSFYPHIATTITKNDQHWLEKLNRIGMVYFRPLVMAILKNVKEESDRIELFKRIERFIFISFRMNGERANFRSTEFYNAARDLDKSKSDQLKVTLDGIKEKLDNGLSDTFKDSKFVINNFQYLLERLFKRHVGYYGWSGLRYFLYEYELSLLSQSRQKKTDWNDLLKTEKDAISIEHVYPQTETAEWAPFFIGINEAEKERYGGTLGNLLLLSKSINSSLQNDSFESKKNTKHDGDNIKIRNGYSDGSHSEIEVSKLAKWGPHEIRARGLKLLRFMETRWGFAFKNDEDREKLLFLTIDSST